MALLAATSLSASAWAGQAGTLDPSFGNGTDGGNDNATDVVLDSEGHIIVAGYHQQDGKSRVSVLRFDDTGKLDESFGAADQQTPKGTVSMAIGEGNALANGMTAQGDRLILVGGGSTSGNGNSNIALMRLLAK